MRIVQPAQTMFSVSSVLSSAFTMDTTSSMTVTAHGFSVGDKVRVSSSTTLPDGLAASTDYYVVKVVSANVVQIAATPGGTAITTADAGTGTHTVVLKSKVIMVQDFKTVNLGFFSASNANLTLKIQISDQIDVDFEAAQSSTNRWDYAQLKDLQNNNSLDGDTGIVLSGTDDNRMFEINTNGQVWICGDITAWSAGKINLMATCYSD